ncbi:hypothetical protein [Microbacterium sp. P5_E9]
MTATITATNGAGTTSPLTVLSPYETLWTSRNIIHDLVGGDIAVSLVAPRPRSGVLELLYPDEPSAFQCAALHEARSAFTLVETDRPSVSMTYVVDGDVTLRLDEDTLELFIVSIGFQAVNP